MKPKLTTVDPSVATQFRGVLGFYRFPIPQILHPNYGRIEAIIEIVPKRGKFAKLLVWFKQHEIDHLKGLFEIPLPRGSTLITSPPISRGQFAGWALGACAEHNGVAWCAYPPDGVTALWIEPLSTSTTVRWDFGDADPS